MSISISANSTATEQLQHCKTYIRSQIQRCDLDNTNICFLPPSTINALASLSNIEAICTQDPGLARMQWPSHSRKHFAEKVFKHGRKCFVMTVFEALGMDFLIKLLNVVYDEDLPVLDRELVEPEYRDSLDTFMGTQAMVCAPIFTMGDFEQQAPFLRSLPFVEAHWHRQRSSGDVYKVVFHREHLGVLTTSRVSYASFNMKVFEDMEAATRHASWKRKEFGFVCEGKYYLCYCARAWNLW